MTTRVTVAIVVGLMTAIAIVAAASARPTAGTTIDIGWVGDKSGPTASSQLPALHGLEAYIKYVNGKGGVNGRQINLIERDDQYNPSTELSYVKSLISDDHVPAIMGLSQSSGFASVLPVLAQSKVVGIPVQSAGKLASDPFQPYIFAATCSYGDQAWVGAGYGLKRLQLKSYKGLTVGIAAIAVTSGQEWIDAVTTAVKKYGATNIVVQQMPAAVVNADVQVQDFQSKGVKVVFLLHAIAGGTAWLRSASKYGFKVPTITNNGLAQDIIFTTSPHDVSKDTVGENCYDPPYLAKTAQGKLVQSVGRQQGFSSDDLRAANFTNGWVAGQILVQGLKNANGDYSSAGIKKGLEKIKNLETGVSPPISFGPKCHIPFSTLRPYTYNYKTNGLQPVGSWAQWKKYDPHPYAAPGTCGVPRK